MPDASSAGKDESYLDGAAAQVAEANAEAGQDKPADQSQDAKPKSMLEAVQQAVAVADKGDGASSSPGTDGEGSEDSETAEGKPESQEADKGKPDSEGKDESEEKLPFHKHPRWQQMKRDRDEAREGAKVAQQLRSYMDEAGLTTEEVNQGFQIMSLIKSDPKKALEALTPILHELQGLTGERLPEDLQQQVAQGYVSEAAARELAATKAENARLKAAAQNRDAGARRDLAKAAGNAASAWETNWSKSDPDYSLKKTRVLEKIKLKVFEGAVPKTPQEAVAIADAALAEVNTEMAGLRPKKSSIVPAGGDVTATDAAPKPTTFLDVVKQGARAAR